MRDLCRHPELKIVLTDKNMGMGIIELSEYNSRINNELSLSIDSYSQLTYSINDHQQFQRKTILSIVSLIKQYCCDSRIDKIVQFINYPLQKPLKLCHLFGLPKVHKPGNRMRLIFPMSSHPFGPTHKFIASMLEFIVRSIDSVIFHVLEVVDVLCNKTWFNNSVIIKADIALMYPSANIDLVLKAICFFHNNSFHLSRFIDVSALQQIIKYALSNLEFVFNNTLFYQKKGVPIGSPCGPALAILALHFSIMNNLCSFCTKFNINFFGIYFDDILLFINSSLPVNTVVIQQELASLISDNSQCFSIDASSFESCTVLQLLNKPFSFLDIDLYAVRSTDYTSKILCRPFYKQMGSYQYVPWKSAHPPSVKRSIIIGKLCRRFRLCSLEQDWLDTCEDLKIKLLKRGYPMVTIMN